MKCKFETVFTKGEYSNFLSKVKADEVGVTLEFKRPTLRMLAIYRYCNNKFYLTLEVYEKQGLGKYIFWDASDSTEINENTGFVSVSVDLGKDICIYSLSVE